MIKNEETYCVVPHKLVREMGAYEAIIFGTIYTLLRKTDGIGEVKNETIMELCGISNKMSLSRYIRKLIDSGYIEKRKGDGRGNISIYYVTEKGNNLLLFTGKKGNKNDIKRVTEMNEKGNNLIPFLRKEPKEYENEDKNEEIKKESGGENARDAREHHALSDTTTTFFENKIFNNSNENDMKNFEEFWQLFGGDKEFAHEKENCERVWFATPEEWQGKLLAQLRCGKRYRVRENDNPYWYLKNYEGQDVQLDLPFVRQGTQAFARWLAAAERENKAVVLMRYPVDEKGNGQLAYCFASDKELMLDAGAVFIRDYDF